MLRAPADSITVPACDTRRGTRPRARRQIDFASIRDVRRAGRRRVSHQRLLARRGLRGHARLPARAGRRDPRGGSVRLGHHGTRPRRPARARRAARRGQFRDHDAAPGRDPRGTCVSDGDRRRRLAAAPAHAPDHRAAHAHGRADRFGRRPRAADHRRRRPPGDRLRTGDAQRPGQERRPARGPARVRPHQGRRAGAHAGSYGTRARSVRRAP